MDLLTKAQQFIDSLPAHQKPVQMMRPYQYFLEAHGYIHLWFRNKEDTKEMHADLHPEGWVWYYTDDDDNDYGTDEGYDEELPPEFYARLNELFPNS